MSGPAFIPADRDLSRVDRTLHSKFLALQAKALEIGSPIFATEGMRTKERQAYLYALGRTITGLYADGRRIKIVTHAEPGESMHETGRAIDFAFERPKGQDIWKGPWFKIGELAEELGLEWGGRWVGRKQDMPHLQLPEET